MGSKISYFNNESPIIGQNKNEIQKDSIIQNEKLDAEYREVYERRIRKHFLHPK